MLDAIKILESEMEPKKAGSGTMLEQAMLTKGRIYNAVGAKNIQNATTIIIEMRSQDDKTASLAATKPAANPTPASQSPGAAPPELQGHNHHAPNALDPLKTGALSRGKKIALYSPSLDIIN